MVDIIFRMTNMQPKKEREGKEKEKKRKINWRQTIPYCYTRAIQK